MTQEEITEGNKLIAEYIGGKFDGYGWEFKDSNIEFFKNLTFVYYKSQELWFHQSWYWLMPLVENIINENNSAVELCGNNYLLGSKYFCSILPDQTNSQSANSENSLIEATYMAVIKYLKWYNSQIKEDSCDGMIDWRETQ